jgi:hypothetical protein
LFGLRPELVEFVHLPAVVVAAAVLAFFKLGLLLLPVVVLPEEEKECQNKHFTQMYTV